VANEDHGWGGGEVYVNSYVHGIFMVFDLICI